jgi:hypothetical protein
MQNRWIAWGIASLTLLAASGCRANLGNLFDLW